MAAELTCPSPFPRCTSVPYDRPIHFTSSSGHGSGKMEARQPWSSFNDRKNTSYNGRDTYKIPRMTAGSLPAPTYSEPYYNQPYGQSYDQSYVQPPGESHGEPSSAPLLHHSDGSYQGYPKQAAAQSREPWKQNTTECLCCCPAHEGRMCATLAAALPGLMGAAAGQSGGAGNKPYFQFSGNKNQGALSSFLPNFNTMDPVQKAVMKHTFGKVRRQGGKRKRPIRCDVCKINFNSDSQAQAHYGGSRHVKKLKLEKTSTVPPKAPAGKAAGKASEGKLLYCSICKVSVNSTAQLQAHNLGGKHKSMLDSGKTKPDVGGFGAATAPKPAALPKGSSVQVKSFQCERCNIHVNSEIQLKQHLSSKRHTDRVAGKPTKIKFVKQQAEGTTEEATVAAGSSDGSSPGSVRASQATPRTLPY
ncbi:zinc finger protein 385B [Stigmatopora nigra]